MLMFLLYSSLFKDIFVSSVVDTSIHLLGNVYVRDARRKEAKRAVEVVYLKRKIRNRLVVQLTIFSDFLDSYSRFGSSPRIVAITAGREAMKLTKQKAVKATLGICTSVSDSRLLHSSCSFQPRHIF